MKGAVFASGNGSNFEALANYFQHRTDIEIVVLFSDQPNCYALKRAPKYGIPSESFSPKGFSDKKQFEEAINQLMKKYQVEWIFLAGYMRMIGPTLLEPFRNRIVNIHPSLLPKYPGKNSIRRAYDAKEKQTGVTIHLVDEGMDSGPILKQETVEIFPEDTLENLEERVHQTEHALYPQVVETLILRKQAKENV